MLPPFIQEQIVPFGIILSRIYCIQFYPRDRSHELREVKNKVAGDAKGRKESVGARYNV
jgi:hypothetical protein